MKLGLFFAGAAVVMTASPAAAQIAATANTNASQLATALQGSGVAFTSATRTGDADIGTFTGGTAALGIDRGVVLTTGSLNCVSPVNSSEACTGGGASNSLSLTFTANSASLFFNYVFASEEYNRYVGSSFNDVFSLSLNGLNYNNVNLATLPDGTAVAINSVNPTQNAAYFRNNNDEAVGGSGGVVYPSLGLPIEYDGLTTVLTASATNLVIGSVYSLTFNISDIGDSTLDSAVFIQGGSVGVVTPPTENAVPEPASWAMMMFGIGMVGGAMRRRSRQSRVVAIA